MQRGAEERSNNYRRRRGSQSVEVGVAEHGGEAIVPAGRLGSGLARLRLALLALPVLFFP
jgi:hypothetical protein